jgi:fucose 4-O-acetylase-like acetyltransferase
MIVPRSEAGRHSAIDYLKAAAVIAIVANHAIRPPWDPRATALDEAVLWLVQFHVPTFLMVSGFLYGVGGAIDLARVRSRLARVLVPYVVATVIMQATGMAEVTTLGQAVVQLLTASALPIYYYVFIITYSIAFIWPLSKLPDTYLRGLFLALCLYPVVAWLWPQAAFSYDYFWTMRDPLTYFVYFLGGWLARTNWPALAAHQRKPILVLCVLAALAAFATQVVERPDTPAFFAVLRMVYSVGVVGLIVLVTAERKPGSVVAFLSTSTYTIYLYHFAFILLARPYLPEDLPALNMLAQLTVGLVASAVLVLVVRRTLGARARLVLGA